MLRMQRTSGKRFVRLMQWIGAAWLLLALGGCGGGSPLGNTPEVGNSQVSTNQVLSFAYFQRCVNPIFLAQLQTQLNGTTVTNTCAAAGCHASATGAGGAFRIVPSAQLVDLTSAANTVATIRATDMYKNFVSAQGETVINTPAQSRLLNKPELNGTLHGGGLVFPDKTDPHVQLITYWISNPAPIGQDEFSTATYSMFSNNDPMNGTCNTQ